MLKIGKVYKRMYGEIFMFDRNQESVTLSTFDSVTVVDAERRTCPVGSFAAYKFLKNNEIYICHIGWTETNDLIENYWEEIC